MAHKLQNKLLVQLSMSVHTLQQTLRKRLLPLEKGVHH